MNEYQVLASRTMRNDKSKEETVIHALHGMASEVGEVHALYQKAYQGHKLHLDRIVSELGDLLWFIAEWCTVNEIDMNDVMAANIEKLKARYPDGFSEERSLHRAKGDL